MKMIDREEERNMTVLQIFSIVANIGVIIVDSVIIVLLVKELRK